MSAPILATKLYIPPTRPNIVLRPRLIEQLIQGLHRKLTLVSAPAGFGKSTLVSEWVNESGRAVAWLSLDKGDNDPTRFLAYFTAALQTLRPTIGEGMLTALQSPQPPPVESVVTTLLNDIAAVPDSFILVLDDYHLIDSQPIDNAIAFLVERQPPQMHLVIASREEPNLPLPRLRVRGQLTELLAADLRFTIEETADFLNRAMGLNLSAEDIAALEKRTEGWIAGLQLAALALQGSSSMQGQEHDTAGLIQSFSGSHRFVLDYLVEEVLQQQPERVQTFLLYTSILERLCAPLCDVILGDLSISGQETLAYIEQANLFIIPLDNERRWYRYHHLFADLLRQRLQQWANASVGEKKVSVEALHQRASVWFEENGLELEAFQHAAAANDIERTERLIEGGGVALYFRGVVTPIVNWLASLPREVMDSRPSLWVTYAAALTLTGQTVSAVEEILFAAESSLETAELPDDNKKDLTGRIAAIRAMLAIPPNDGKTMLAEAKKAIENLSPDNLAFLSPVKMTLGYAHMLMGERAASKQAYRETVAIAQLSGNSSFALAGYIGLAGIQAAENQLYQSEATFQQVLELAGESPQPYVCAAYLGLTQIAYEWNDWNAVNTYGQQGIKYGIQLPSVDVPAACQVILARMNLVQGDVKAAASLLDEADQTIREKNLNHPMPEIIAARVEILLRQGRLEAAAQLAHSIDLPLSQAKVSLAQGDSAAALALLEPHRRQMAANGWHDAWLKAVVLEAVARQTHGEGDTAVQLLQEALAAAEPGGFVRLFVDEGRPMARLLSEAAVRGTMPGYVGKLLAAFEGEERPADTALPATSQPLLEPLSQRELEVLQLVAQGLSNREIGERLFLALDTIKGHNRKIFGKLGVNRRTEAVARARDLGLL